MSANLINELRTAEEIVRQVLEVNPAAKDSDKELFIGVMQIAGINLSFLQQQQIRELFALETYTRARRIIQNDKKTLIPSEKIREQRAAREVEHRVAAMHDWNVEPEQGSLL